MTNQEKNKQIRIAVETINIRIGQLILEPDPNGENAKKIHELIASAKCLLDLITL